MKQTIFKSTQSIVKAIMLSICLLAVIISCSQKQAKETDKSANNLSTGEGYVEVEGGKVWYGIMGGGDKTPILCLHGGPGGTSAGYYKLSELAEERPIIFFDQLGSGRSDHHQDTSLLKVEKFVEQVHAVKEALMLDNFYLMGGSWGGALALEYYLVHPEGIKGLIFRSPYFSTPIWEKDADILVSQLPDTIKAAIYQAEKDSTFNTEAYAAANTYFLKQHGRRTEKVQHPYDTVPSPGNSFIYNYMWGPSEFTATGTLKTYDNHEALKKVKVPALFTTGEYDEARPETIEELSKLVPQSSFVVIPDAGHSTLSDNRSAMIGAIQTFLKEQEE